MVTGYTNISIKRDLYEKIKEICGEKAVADCIVEMADLVDELCNSVARLEKEGVLRDYEKGGKKVREAIERMAEEMYKLSRLAKERFPNRVQLRKHFEKLWPIWYEGRR